MQLQELLAQAHDVMTIKTSLRGAHREERDRRDSSGECSSAARAAAVVSHRRERARREADSVCGRHRLACTSSKVRPVTWQPALNLNRVILGGQIVAIVLFVTIRAIVHAHRMRSFDVPVDLRSGSGLRSRPR
jgi:hypothetical protein